MCDAPRKIARRSPTRLPSERRVLRVGTIRRRGSRRVAACGAFPRASSPARLVDALLALTRLDPGHRDAASDPGRRKQVCTGGAQTRARAEHRRGVVLMDALRVAFAEEEGAGRRKHKQTDPRAADRPFPRVSERIGARRGRSSEGDDSDVIDVVPATARWLTRVRARGFRGALSGPRVVFGHAERTAKQRLLRLGGGDGDDARLRALGLAPMRRDTLDAAAALARRFRRVDGSPSRVPPRGRRLFVGADGRRNRTDTRRRSGDRRESARLDRVDPEAFAFAVNRSTPSPRAVAPTPPLSSHPASSTTTATRTHFSSKKVFR